jgi:hypothetical protein
MPTSTIVKLPIAGSPEEKMQVRTQALRWRVFGTLWGVTTRTIQE